MKQIGIFGTSGMARETGDIAEALGLTPIYVTHDPIQREHWALTAELVLETDVERYNSLSFIIGIADPEIRKSIAQRFGHSLRFANLIHPTASFGNQQRQVLENSRGTIVAAGTRFTNGISVGEFCIFNQNTTIAHDSIIESFVHIAPGANVSGNVHIKEGCWVGAGAVINQGSELSKLKIGPKTTIASGAVVVSNCAAQSVYAGVPAQKIK